MNRFFIDEIADSTNYIKDQEDIKHISKVLRLQKDDEIEIVDSENQEYIMKIQDIQKNEIKLVNIQKVDIKREPDLKITIYQGIPKSTKMDFICQKLTEIGIYKIVPVKFARCVATDINKNKIERFEKIIKEASKQSKRTFIPKITNPITFKQMIQDMDKNDKNILFYEDERNRTIKDFINENLNKNIKNLGIIIGSEGGIAKEEIEILKEKTDILSLGNRILRTETAGLIATSVLLYEFEN